MPFEIYRTTAEHIIGAADAALQSQVGVDAELVAAFLDTTKDSARDALLMACQLSLVDEPTKDAFRVRSPCVKYLCTSIRDEKAAVMRFLLEQYEPFQIFKLRLDYATGVVGEASTQTRALCGIAAHRDAVSATLVDLGTYANAIRSQGAGLYLPIDAGHNEYLKVIDEVIADRQAIELYVGRRLGREAVDWIDRGDVLENIITAYQRLAACEDDSRAPIVHAGNAFESFLAQLGAHHGVSLANSHGINAKADALAKANKLSGKHRFMAKYLGHVRNAADHGSDSEIGQQWKVCSHTSKEYVNVTFTMIRNLVDALNGIHVV
ncbi:MAG: hypothetical protein KAY24_11715 [Candidatus Eisenbacteria sp.]|nr:hypothetical protein [Candidatus Eisenbacteria bacterium]